MSRLFLRRDLATSLRRVVLPCLRRRYDHASLAFTDGADKVYDAHGRCSACTFHYKTLIRKDRRHILKIVSSLALAWMEAVYGRYIEKCTELLTHEFLIRIFPWWITPVFKIKNGGSGWGKHRYRSLPEDNSHSG